MYTCVFYKKPCIWWKAVCLRASFVLFLFFIRVLLYINFNQSNIILYVGMLSKNYKTVCHAFPKTKGNWFIWFVWESITSIGPTKTFCCPLLALFGSIDRMSCNFLCVASHSTNCSCYTCSPIFCIDCFIRIYASMTLLFLFSTYSYSSLNFSFKQTFSRALYRAFMLIKSCMRVVFDCWFHASNQSISTNNNNMCMCAIFLNYQINHRYQDQFLLS